MKYCNKQSVSSGRTLHYLKESLKSEADVAYEKRMELQEFANDYLAYLIDDEWSVSVWGFTTSFKIVLMSPRSVKRNRVHHDDVTWLSVKNRIIPFVQMLSNKYHLGYEGSSSIIRIEGTYSDDIHIKDIDQLEDLSDDMLFYSFSIVVKKDGMKHLKMFKESFRAPSSFREEVQEFCENYLAYLIDDDFSIETNLYGLDPVSVSFVLIRRFASEVEPILFSWVDVKDYYIPFLQMLQREYNVITADTPSNNSEIQVLIRTGSTELLNSPSVYYTLHEALEDKINPYDKIVFIKILITEK